ncbi:class I SAM-dependent methyltransferase [Azospirillum ramasamyi]|uniref:Class I SAM-dependent methyltransferase n=1 Tax=Azospirillum ramasamyi TaxID=682998 RepID=A0A2U9SKE6_9PROT|nr:class I SAM-dependent methyltransferase [Azospirillum ramasamyi]AWU98068.1 class I SAM-dependent methyltransferase [Azospirillum ramasamyi]
MTQAFRLFGDFAHRYDLHTPPDHYRDDHAFVLDEFRAAGARRILDVGCGTGVFVEKALTAGLDAHGIDAAPAMVAQAERRLGPGRAAVQAMEEIGGGPALDGICALSWVINYAANADAAIAILRRMYGAMAPGGRLLLQCAHAPNMQAAVFEDREPGADGTPDDVVFLFQFAPLGPDQVKARYVYAGKSAGELLWEEHALNIANAELLARLAGRVGFSGVRIYGSWRRDPLGGSVSAWVVADRGAAA